MAAGEIKQIGQYEIKGVLGRGGMATVYRAYQPSLDREVAIKVMSSQFSGDTTFQERFRREARAIGILRHPNILAVYDFGQEGATPYLITELMEGKTLREPHGESTRPESDQPHHNPNRRCAGLCALARFCPSRCEAFQHSVRR